MFQFYLSKIPYAIVLSCRASRKYTLLGIHAVFFQTNLGVRLEIMSVNACNNDRVDYFLIKNIKE